MRDPTWENNSALIMTREWSLSNWPIRRRRRRRPMATTGARDRIKFRENRRANKSVCN